MIDRLIDAGVDCLHPLQAMAANMDAETLARDFKGRIAFMGGIDTQSCSLARPPEDVNAEVHRVKRPAGPAPDRQPQPRGVLPDVPPANVEAMAQAARETI